MKFILPIFIAISITGCATYKLLEPKPDVTATEAGYVELKKGEDYFELSKDGKYFVKFPSPNKENFYLVIRSGEKSSLTAYLTRAFDDGKGEIIKMKEDPAGDEYSFVYPLDTSVPIFFWVIDGVSKELLLKMDYRYTPIWRYKFETRYGKMSQILADNTVRREYYDSLGIKTNFDGFNFSDEIKSVEQKTGALQGVKNELNDIKSLFPTNILNSVDPAYKNYVDLSQKVDSELEYHKKYQTVLDVFQSEFNSRKNPQAFMDQVDKFNQFFSNLSQYPTNVVDEAKRVFGSRQTDITDYLDNQIKRKTTGGEFPMNGDAISKLFGATGTAPSMQLRAATQFISEYNQKTKELDRAERELEAIDSEVRNLKTWPDDGFYGGINRRLSGLINNIPARMVDTFGAYSRSIALTMLNSRIGTVTKAIETKGQQFTRAGQIVQNINQFRSQGNLKAGISLLKRNQDLDFLLAQYSGIDQSSLTEQKNAIVSALKQQRYADADNRIRILATDTDFLNPSSIIQQQRQVVKDAETDMLTAIESGSLERAKSFVTENGKSYQNVETLYQSEVFTPIYTPTFTSGTQAELNRRLGDLQAKLDDFKFNQFPAGAIESLFSEFTSDPSRDGVEKGRAIIYHGKMYKGKERRILNAINEVDPDRSKLLSRAANYRKVYVLPMTNNRTGVNEYVVKINIQIESDATFPVWDVNIRMPKKVAQGSGEGSWYESLLFNKKVLKNEGRFSITAPNAINDYECQITPVQTEKGKENILEIRFKQSGLQIFELNVMAQTPLIKKN